MRLQLDTGALQGASDALHPRGHRGPWREKTNSPAVRTASKYRAFRQP